MTIILILQDGWGARIYDCDQCGKRFTELDPDFNVTKCPFDKKTGESA